MKMPGIILSLWLVALCGTGIAVGDTGGAEPIMAIEFFPEMADYGITLEEVVMRILDENASASFDIVAAVPIKGPRRIDKRTKRRASQHASEVAAKIVALGVGAQRTRIRFEHDTSANHVVVKIYPK
jgi:hypothetical protein